MRVKRGVGHAERLARGLVHARTRHVAAANITTTRDAFLVTRHPAESRPEHRDVVAVAAALSSPELGSTHPSTVRGPWPARLRRVLPAGRRGDICCDWIIWLVGRGEAGLRGPEASGSCAELPGSLPTPYSPRTSSDEEQTV